MAKAAARDDSWIVEVKPEDITLNDPSNQVILVAVFLGVLALKRAQWEGTEDPLTERRIVAEARTVFATAGYELVKVVRD